MSKWKRRTFLKVSAGVAAGAAAGPLMWPGEAQAQWSNTPEKGVRRSEPSPPGPGLVTS
jgi:hypothetical protein